MMKALPVISNQKMNDYVKELCKKAEVADPVQIVRFWAISKRKLYIPIRAYKRAYRPEDILHAPLEKGTSAEEVRQISGHRIIQAFPRM